MKKIKRETKAVLAALGGNAVWGFAYPFTRIAQRYSMPIQQLALRVTVTFLAVNLMLLLGWGGGLHLRGKKLRPLILLCLSEISCFFFESYGLFYTNATVTSVFMAAAPIAAILLAAFFLHEYPTWGQVLFCIVSIAGVIMISMAGKALGVVSLLGVLLLVCLCFSSGSYKAVNRSAGEFTPFERTYMLAASCTVVCTTVALFQLGGDVKAYLAPFASWQFTLSTLAVGVICSLASNLLMNYAASGVSVTKMANFGALTTVCSTFAGVVFLHEPISGLMLLGTAIILVGVWQVNKRGK